MRVLVRTSAITIVPAPPAGAPTAPAAVPPPSATASIVINEIHYAPADKTRPAEFIEVFNTGNSPADVSGWRLGNAVTFTLGCGLAGLGGALGAEMLPIDPVYPFRYLATFLIVVLDKVGADHE